MSPASLVEIAGWSLGATCVWLATLSSLTLPELCIAFAAGIPCGILAAASRRALGASWRFRSRWALWAGPVTAALLVQLVDLLRMSATAPRGGHLATFDLPEEPEQRADAREALGTLALSATPGSVVADCDPRRRRITVHVLVSAGPRVDEVIRR